MLHSGIASSGTVAVAIAALMTAAYTTMLTHKIQKLEEKINKMETTQSAMPDLQSHLSNLTETWMAANVKAFTNHNYQELNQQLTDLRAIDSL